MADKAPNPWPWFARIGFGLMLLLMMSAVLWLQKISQTLNALLLR